MNAVIWTNAPRVISGYKTISDEAAVVLAGVSPIKLQAEERRCEKWAT